MGERSVSVPVVVGVGLEVRASGDAWEARVTFGGAPIVVRAATRDAAVRLAELAAARALGRFLRASA